METESDRDFLYLPCEKNELDKTLERLDVTSLNVNDVKISVEESCLPDTLMHFLEKSNSFEYYNSLCKIFDSVGLSECKHLSKLVEFTKTDDISELDTLIKKK